MHTISLTPRWSPDASRIAFHLFEAGPQKVVSPQICMYSMDANKVRPFPGFRGSTAAPLWSPDGAQIMFSSSMLGNPELFVVDANGSRPKGVTFSNAASTSQHGPQDRPERRIRQRSRRYPKLYLMKPTARH